MDFEIEQRDATREDYLVFEMKRENTYYYVAQSFDLTWHQYGKALRSPIDHGLQSVESLEQYAVLKDARESADWELYQWMHNQLQQKRQAIFKRNTSTLRLQIQ